MLLPITVIFCAVTIWTDFAHRKVSNIALAVTLVAASMVLISDPTLKPTVTSRAVGFSLGLLVMLPGYVLGRMGAGDVKFLAVTGLFTGPMGLVTVWGVGSLLAFAHALLVRMQASAAWTTWCDLLSGLLPRGRGVCVLRPERNTAEERGIPYAAYLAV